MKRAIIALAISIIAILGASRYLANQPEGTDECGEMQREAYAVCLQEERYFKENVK
jgi:hypothetical protein